ncbi:MAG: tryptophan/tyrosine permease [Legionellales bacterium RIFCSPHIGHO2_12_FULL_37_14]|nr:MAG: tryptophan/tyrosine permease [Legionellales bacterium RIFCSPHIGHO2_12_FULL_37_14]
MLSKIIGGVLLIVGTSIGAGMLALPVASSTMGFWPSSCLLTFCWLIMTMGALYMTEVSLYVDKGKHLISMAAATLGSKGIVVAWISYVLLLYTLLSAYISGGADVFGSILAAINVKLSDKMAISLFTLIFGLIVYQGIRPVDFVNRILMFGKLGIYVFLVTLMIPNISFTNFTPKIWNLQSSLVLIFITSFGFAIIVPNLRDYFDRDILVLKKVIYIGALIPFICYVIWDAVIMGLIPLNGRNGLAVLQTSDHATSQLALFLSQHINSPFVDRLFNAFTSICMLTAFLGVALSLISFLGDGFKLEQKGGSGLLLFTLTFMPPWLIVMFYPGAYLHALSYAGSCCIVLLLMLPAWMSLKGRTIYKAGWRAPCGKYLQIFLIILSLLLLIKSIIYIF